MSNKMFSQLIAVHTTSVGLANKNKALKKAILSYLDNNGQATIADLCKELHISSPKAMALVNELCDDELINETGKLDSTGGRRAASYSLYVDAAYFLGVAVLKDSINIGLIDFKKNIVEIKTDIPYILQNNMTSFDALVATVQQFIKKTTVPKKKILGMGINLSGRVNSKTGYSYSYFNFDEKPVAATLEKIFKIPVVVDNDSRSMALGEYYFGVAQEEKNILFINLDYGLGLGIVADGKIFYGKSGFSGELGHIPFFDNEIICHCGKKGCLETEASGYALVRKFKEKLQTGSISQLSKKYKNVDDILLQDIVKAALNEDVLAIELLSEIGEKIGKGIAALVNLFNPELMILGGVLSETGDYVRLPIKTSLNKYSINLVNNDAKLRMSVLGKNAGVLGACLIARDKVLNF
jgi:glucokinase-like ROK family protein